MPDGATADLQSMSLRTSVDASLVINDSAGSTKQPSNNESTGEPEPRGNSKSGECHVSVTSSVDVTINVPRRGRN